MSKPQHDSSTTTNSPYLPFDHVPQTRRAQLRQRTQAFCSAFTDLASNPPAKILDTHFTSTPKITEHGPNPESAGGAHPDTNLPFLGRTFTGREECLEYFRLLSDTLEYEPLKDSFPSPEGYVVDDEAVGPDDPAPKPGFGGQGVVCVVGRGRFRSVGTGRSWEEEFIYRLSGFDDRGRIGHWEIWADPLSAHFAVNDRPTGLADG